LVAVAVALAQLLAVHWAVMAVVAGAVLVTVLLIQAVAVVALKPLSILAETVARES
jgi:hypothetical protein